MRKILLLLLLCPIIMIGQIPAKLHNTYVHDYSHVLTADQVDNLNRTIYNIDTANKIKFAIILINELPPDYNIEDYAREISIKWEVGKGIIYVAAINQRKQRLEVSAHLEGIIPDITARHITDNIKPHFKKKDYYSGLAGMINEIDILIKAEAATTPKLGKEKILSHSEKVSIIVFVISGSLIGILFLIFYINGRRKKIFQERLKEEKEKLDAGQKERIDKMLESKPIYNISTNRAKKDTYTPPKINDDDYTPPTIIYTPPASSDDNNRSSGYDSGSNNNNYDSGGGSADSYSGGGSPNDW